MKNCLCLFIAIPILLASWSHARPPKSIGNPDFTKGEQLDPRHAKKSYRERTLGPTGLWGAMYSQSMFQGATRDTRQFLITSSTSASLIALS